VIEEEEGDNLTSELLRSSQDEDGESRLPNP